MLTNCGVILAGFEFCCCVVTTVFTVTKKCAQVYFHVFPGWARQRNYMTAKAARPDVYRAANSILRMAVDGRLCMYMRPPGYTAESGQRSPCFYAQLRVAIFMSCSSRFLKYQYLANLMFCSYSLQVLTLLTCR